ncbi:ATP-binding cassette domain-containing protein [Streptomyces sp. NPDC057301]|uniref:ATP-binding cassette domain-containing protein n=1 Tax=Streptomyces sp. NPDC057301 TaxID=3346093 RepID=UPI00363EFF34
MFVRRRVATERLVLDVRGVTTDDVHDISLRVHAGEVVGLAGLMGAGRSELALALAGDVPMNSGIVTLDDTPLRSGSPAAVIRAGLGLAPASCRGNQQKVVLARWLARKPKALMDEPTRGIDVGAKAEIYQIIADLAAEGVALLVISSELPELLGLADRIVVMQGGRITGELAYHEATEESILALAMADDMTAAAAPGVSE